MDIKATSFIILSIMAYGNYYMFIWLPKFFSTSCLRTRSVELIKASFPAKNAVRK